MNRFVIRASTSPQRKQGAWRNPCLRCGLVLLLLIAAGCYRSDPARPDKAAVKADGSNSDNPVRVKVVRARRELLKRTTTLPAHIEGFEKTELHARVSGYLRKIHVDIRDRVKKDDVLAELWIPERDQEILQAKALLGQATATEAAAATMVDAAKAMIDETQADLARVEADLAFRKVDYERYVQLLKDNATRGELVDAARNQYRAAAAAVAFGNAKVASAKANLKVEQAKQTKAQANVKVSESNLEQAKIMQKFGKIVAPYDGVITHRHADTGTFVQSATTGKASPLFSMVFVDRLRIIADVAEADSALVKPKQIAALRVDALLGQQFPCKVIRFADALDPGTRTMRVELELDAHDSSLRPGMFGAVTIEIAHEENALLLETNVLLPAAGKPAAMVVENGRAKRREIVIGSNDGIRMHVKEGLKGDEEVISAGKNMVRDGQAVEIVK